MGDLLARLARVPVSAEVRVDAGAWMTPLRQKAGLSGPDGRNLTAYSVSDYDEEHNVVRIEL